MNGLRARWLVLLLGGILLATTVLFGVPGNAEAQGQGKGQGKGKAQGRVQENGWPPGHNKVAVCHKPVGETTDEEPGEELDEKPEEELAEETGHILYLPPPAVRAHLAHGDELITEALDENGVASGGECGTSGTELPPDAEECPPEVFGTAEAQKVVGNDLETVQQNDVIAITVTRDFGLATTGTLSITLRNPSGEPVTFVDGVDATITEDNGTLLIAVKEDVPDLSTTGLEVVSSEGTLCPEDPEESSDPVTLTGTLATTRSGDIALRTKDGKGDSKVLLLVAQTEGQEERLKQLADRKLGKVKVTGAKVNDREAKGAKAKEDRKDALKVTSVKKAEVQKAKKQ